MSGMTQVFNLYILLFIIIARYLRISLVRSGGCQDDSTVVMFPLRRFSSCKAVRLLLKGAGLTMLAFVLIYLFRVFSSSFFKGPDVHACLYGRRRDRMFHGCPALPSFLSLSARKYIRGALPCPLAPFYRLPCEFLTVSMFYYMVDVMPCLPARSTWNRIIRGRRCWIFMVIMDD